MSTRDEPTQASIPVAERLVIARYGSHRVAIGTTMFIWVNLSLLLAFGWAALVVSFDAPAVGPEILPLDWFIVRLAIVLVAGGLTLVFWRSSMAPLDSLRLASLLAIFHRGVLWTQGLLFLGGVSVVLAVLLLLANPGQATKLLLYGAVEVFAIQALFAGYVKTMLEVLLDRQRSFLIVTGLFAAFFGLQSFAISVTAVDPDQNYYLALLAGAFLGAVVGLVSLFLRDRSGSIYPGILVQMLFFSLLIPFLG